MEIQLYFFFVFLPILNRFLNSIMYLWIQLFILKGFTYWLFNVSVNPFFDFNYSLMNQYFIWKFYSLFLFLWPITLSND